MEHPQVELYHFPGACSRVTVCALEMAQLSYKLNLVNLAVSEQTGECYRQISALGKVPALVIDGKPLLENSAILMYIHLLRPAAGIFQEVATSLMRAEEVGGLSFCSGTLQPIVRGLANPQRITSGDSEPVRAKSLELAEKSFGYAEARVAERGWWLGHMSIIDVYLDWAYDVARKRGLDTDAYPCLTSLEDRLGGLAAYAKMKEIESISRSELGLQ